MAISYHYHVIIIIFAYAHMLTEFICYDDDCHLKGFARNPVRASLTFHTAQLASVEMAVDKMHAKGHTDSWCKANCDPSNFTALMKVHIYITSVLITSLQYISRLILKYASRHFPAYQICFHYSQDEPTHFYVLSFDMHNIREEKNCIMEDF